MPSYDETYAYLERHVDALKTNKTGDERQTDGEVFDKKTLLTIYGLMTDGFIDKVHYPISTGKEGNVFYVTDEDGAAVAGAKVYAFDAGGVCVGETSTSANGVYLV